MNKKIYVLKKALGITSLLEEAVAANTEFLLAHREQVYTEIFTWLKEYPDLEIKSQNQLLLDSFFIAFIAGKYDEKFYSLVYKQTLRWYHLGLTENQALILLSKMWQALLATTEKQKDFALDKAICLLIDLVRIMAVNIFCLARELESLKQKASYEAKRIDQAFSLLEANLPDKLVKAYLNHHQWKYLAISQILAKDQEEVLDVIPIEECNLSHWLEAGGKQLIPVNQWQDFEQAHIRVHKLADDIIHFAETKQPEAIYNLLDELETASNLVSETLLNLIDSSITDLASFDSLTKLRNRTTLSAFVEQNLSIAKRFNKRLGIILLDIDHFKSVNDTYGHLQGDQVLIELAGALNEQIRPEDTLFRWGGEEFLIIGISDEQDDNNMYKMAERIRRAIEVSEFCSNTANPLKITSSFGVIEAKYCQDLSMEEVFAQADELLYQAKNAGRNKVKALAMSAVG